MSDRRPICQRNGDHDCDDTGCHVIDNYPCPGCACLPGDGATPGCTHPDGCGFAATADVATEPQVLPYEIGDDLSINIEPIRNGYLVSTGPVNGSPKLTYFETVDQVVSALDVLLRHWAGK